MSNDFVPVILHFNGKLFLDENNRPRYDGGKNKLLKVHRATTYEDFKELVYHRTRINPEEYALKFVFRCPATAYDYTAIKVSDTEDLKGVFDFYPNIPSITIYVKKKTLQAVHRFPQMNDVNPSYVPSTFPEQNEAHNSVLQPEDDIAHDMQLNYSEDIPTYGDEGVVIENRSISITAKEHENITFTSRVIEHVKNEDHTIAKVQFALRDDEDDQWVHDSYANNEDVEFPEMDIEDEIHPTQDIEEDGGQKYVDDSIDNDGDGSSNRIDGFFVGQKFSKKEYLVRNISEWSLKRSVVFRTVRSNTRELTLACSNKQCPWRMHASISRRLLSNEFIIRTLNSEHTCRNTSIVMDSKNLTSKFICQCILPCLKDNLEMTPRNIRDHMKICYHADISYYKAWEARRQAMEELFGDWDGSYVDLPRYLKAVQMSNPGTVYKIKVDSTGDHFGVGFFESVFWAFGPSIEGFHHCRPVLSIDGTHLYGKYPGVLLVATGFDSDGGLYPLAFAVVEAENRENWSWFFSCIQYYIPAARKRTITWISDRMKGLPNALKDGWRISHHHRFCLRHIKANFKREFKNTSLQNLLYSAGRTPDPLRYIELRNRIKEISPDADAWIEGSLGPTNEECWALCKDGGKRFFTMTTNCSESFNGVLKGARALPIILLITRTFHRLNKYFVTRRECSANWDTRYTPKNDKLLKERYDEARSFTITRYASDNWDVTDNKGLSYNVTIKGNDCSCTCNIPLLQHLPCAHVIAATSRLSGGANIDFESLGSIWYSTDEYRKSYEPKFSPVPDHRNWPPHNPHVIQVIPPLHKRKKGRPRSTRIHNEMDTREGERKKMTCSKCKQMGHNKRRCPLV